MMQAKPHPHTIHFTVDGENVETTDPTLTVRQILTLAGYETVENYYLRRVTGNHQETLNNLDQELRVHEKEKFVAVFNGPTQVS
jgi:hypothetical protein